MSTKSVNIDTGKPSSVLELVELLEKQGLDNVLGINEDDEVIKIELYKENESKVERRPHLRYVIYSDDNRFQTEIFLSTEDGTVIHSEYSPVTD